MAALIMNNKDLLYVIKPEEQNESTLRELLTLHPEIQFVSLMGVDFAGNDTDEKIPMKIFLEDIDGFLAGSAAQTDGSSVVLTPVVPGKTAGVYEASPLFWTQPRSLTFPPSPGL